MKEVAFANAITRIVIVCCVTAVAIILGKASVMWWVLLVLFVGDDYKSNTTKEIKEENKNDM